MYCNKCGTQLTPDGLCPNCNTVTAEINNNNPESGFKAPGKFAKSYAAVMTALFVFPATFCTALDLSFHRYDFWFGYVVGALIVAWVCAVLPFMKITPPAVTALICFISIIGYLSYVTYKLKDIPFVESIYSFFLPLIVLFALFVAVDTALINSGKLNWMQIFSLISFEIGVYIIALEYVFVKDFANLHWSPICACGFISVSAVFLAFSYIWNTNKKK